MNEALHSIFKVSLFYVHIKSSKDNTTYHSMHYYILYITILQCHIIIRLTKPIQGEVVI